MQAIVSRIKAVLHWEHWKTIAILLMAYDAVAILVSYGLGLWLRFDFRYSMIPREYLDAYTDFIPFYIVICLVVFYVLRLYRSIWRFASYSELVHIAAASVITTILHFSLITHLFHPMPMSYHLMGAVLQFMAVCIIRFSYRFVLLLKGTAEALRVVSGKNENAELTDIVSGEEGRRSVPGHDTAEKNIMLIGAGSAGLMILRDINKAQSEVYGRIVCIIDDNPNKWHRYMDGIRVVGGRDCILETAEKYRIDTIYLAIPSANAAVRRDILDICKETGCELKTLPGLYQFATGQLTASAMKEVSIEDLLGRDPIKTDLSEVFAFIKGKTVLVTGGGGSIGSELCRQIAAHQPGRLIIFDVYENNAYDIQLELKDKYPDLSLEVLIGSVRDSRRIFQVFETYRPDIVYHAAAHKHVPLMEDSPCESIKNNVFGTYKTAYAAMVHGCQRFVLISTDKAVNPTNIMGASKRMCEMIIQSFDAKIKAGKANEIPQFYMHSGAESADKDGSGEVFRNIRTEFVAVRFGNVLGSNGSVIPIFKRQIEKGGPVTVTHPDIIRYFMTIPEAVSLVLEAGCYAKGGEIFVLDMGKPVKIDTLARNLIRLSGLRPDIDIKVEYTGLRPGEKLYEEKLMAEEGMQKTANALIHIGKPLKFDTDAYLAAMPDFMDMTYRNRDAEIRNKVMELVESYHPIG